MGKILIVDDEESMRITLSLLFKKQGHAITTASSGEEAVAIISKDIFDVIITDLRMEELGGIDVLKAVKAVHPGTEVIILTAYGTIKNAVEAMKLGAFDYLTKPLEPDEGILVVNKALERKSLIGRVEYLRKEVRDKYRFENLVGESPKFKKVLEIISAVAPTDSTVLLLGETGTGKELAAKAIHNLSPRRENNFVALNCGSLPPPILESELFGYVKGAFTGANKNKEGLFSAADRGTLFLDEITATKPEFQVSLLRVLQEREIRRVGDVKTEKVDVRLLVATNKDLKIEVEKLRFRKDLYHRLNVVPVELPPLRDRREDIPLLVEHFVKAYSEKLENPVSGVNSAVIKLFREYYWPGNIRELEHTIERAIIFCRSGRLTVNDFDDIAASVAKPALLEPPAEELTIQEMEKKHIQTVMKMCGGNQTKAAEKLGIGRNTLWRKLKEYKIIPPE